MEMGEMGIWRRVFAGPGAPPQELGELLRDCVALGARYAQLMESASGRRRVLLGRLRQGELENAACLLGISQLAGTPMQSPAPPKRSREPAAGILEQCWQRNRRAMVEYTARSAEAEYGPVFQSLANRAAAHCDLLAQVMGMA